MNNNTAPQIIDIKKNVLEKIASDKVRMKPRFYFILKLTSLFLLLILTLVVSSLLISYILFTLKISGEFFLLGLGLKGLQAFVLLFPWALLLLYCVLLIVLDWLLNQFSFAYHSPFLYLFIITLVSIVVIGYIINSTSLHQNLLSRVQNRQLSVFSGLYGGLADQHKEDGILRGIVVSIVGNTFIVRPDDFDGDIDGGEEKVILSDDSDASKLVHIGENIFIAGDRVNDGIHAYGIREITQ